jgi:hypothetical protein
MKGIFFRVLMPCSSGRTVLPASAGFLLSLLFTFKMEIILLRCWAICQLNGIMTQRTILFLVIAVENLETSRSAGLHQSR